MNLALGLLLAAMLLVLFGAAGPLPRRLSLSPGFCMAVLALFFGAGLVPLLPVGPVLALSVGGFLFPLGLCCLLWQGPAGFRDRLAPWAACLGDLLWPVGLLGAALAYGLCRDKRFSPSAALLGAVLADGGSALWGLLTRKTAVLCLGERLLPAVLALLVPAALMGAQALFEKLDRQYFRVKGDHS